MSNFKLIIKNLQYMRKFPSSLIKLNSVLNHVTLSNNNFISDSVYLNDVVLGKYTYISSRSRLNNVNVGAFVSIGPDCRIGLGLHPLGNNVSTHPVFYTSNNPAINVDSVLYRGNHKELIEETKRIFIGSDVWVGANVIIIDGVTIEDGAVIAAGAVVTRDVKSYEVVGGVPAKHIRYRFSPEQISSLNRLKWWDNEDEIILNKIELFCDVDRFLKNDDLQNFNNEI
ncbi:CatB-related O-acetyltransferase [Aeromonas veronii]|uniref:CatB-related O-acetyltransferase n=1 Tax=Aeromonas veronii TaxID=654 RepID=UPI00366AEDE6